MQADGWSVSVSDLYAMEFDPCEQAEHYADRLDSGRFDAQAEQRHASETHTLPKVVTDELPLMDRADLLVLQYPMWWHLPPAMLKGWFDRVLAVGVEQCAVPARAGRVSGNRTSLQSAADFAENPCTAIELLKIRELSSEEAAGVTGISSVALRVSVHRAIKALRVSLHSDTVGSNRVEVAG